MSEHTMRNLTLYSLLLSAACLSGCGGQDPQPGSSSSGTTSSTPSSAVSSSVQSSSSSVAASLTLDESNSGLCNYTGTIENEHIGFNRTGYINGDNRINSKIVWHVTAAQGINSELTVRFANGGQNARTSHLVVNSQDAGSIAFSSGSAWDDWQTESLSIWLDAGDNTIELIADTAEGPANIDELLLTGDSLQAGDCQGIVQELNPVTIWIAGDSTVSTYNDTASPNDQAGWGQMLHESYDSKVTVQNKAIGGRTARRFIDEGRLDEIWNNAKSGDYFLVQFGTNDGHRTATYTINGQTIPYYLDPATDFKTYLKRYIDGAQSRGLNLVFVTPPPRNSAYCTGGNGTGGHAQAMRELAAEYNIPLADLNYKVVTYLTAICPAPTPENFFFLRADGSVDGTHFQENGARIMSRMVADGIGEANLELDEYRQ